MPAETDRQVEFLHQLYEDTTAALRDLQQRKRELEKEEEQLRKELEGFAAALQRRGYERPEDAGRKNEDGGWEAMDRTEAVLAVLKAADRALGPADVAERLAQTGREGDERQLVSAALAHLKRTGRAHRIGHGEWVAGPAPEEGATETPNYEGPNSARASKNKDDLVDERTTAT